MRKSGILHIILSIILENFGKIHCFHKKVGTFSIENQNDFQFKKKSLLFTSKSGIPLTKR